MTPKIKPGRCKVCLAQEPLNERGVCLGCEWAKQATDAGTSYGKLSAANRDAKLREAERLRSEKEYLERMENRRQVCVVCGDTFVNTWKRPRRTCGPGCARLAANRPHMYGRNRKDYEPT